MFIDFLSYLRSSSIEMLIFSILNKRRYRKQGDEKACSVSEMDFLANLLPAVPSLELDPTSQYQNVTFLQNMFFSAFLGTFIANLMGQTVRGILGESVIDGHIMQPSFMRQILNNYLFMHILVKHLIIFQS